MADRYKPITKAQLKGFFKDYREAFPEWSVECDVVLSRTVEPVKQVIFLVALSYGAYRLQSCVRVPGPPEGGQLLFQQLDIRHREVRPREHATKFPLVIKAMEEQFLPPVREPLEPARVLQLAEDRAISIGIENTPYLSSLASLSAYLGDLDRSLMWCERALFRLANMGRKLADWELQLIAFNQELKASIQTGRVREFLQARADQSPI